MSRPVVVVGDVMADVVVTLSGPLAAGSDTPARIEHRGGGSGANVAAWLARAGAGPVLHARVGDDPAGRGALAALAAEGVELLVSVDAERPTGTCVVLVDPDGERSMLPDRGANTALAPAPLPEDAAHLHVAGYVLLDPGARPAALHALAEARRLGCPVSVDPASSAPLAEAGATAFLAWIGRVDLLLPNAAEAAVLTGLWDPGEPRGPSPRTRTRSSSRSAPRERCGATAAPSSTSRPCRRTPWTRRARATPSAAGLLAARTAGASRRQALAAGAALAAHAVRRPGAR
jgi:sugar/nucleoside kinase (ribokinase family)